MALGALVHGPLEVDIPTDANYEIILKKQEVRFRQVSDAEVMSPSPTFEVTIPEGLTMEEVEGVPGEEFE
jgi:hypothetical protein